MKIAIITDTHFGARNDNVNFNEYFYQFYEGVFFPYLQQHNIKTVLHLGDLMDRRKYVSFKTAKVSSSLLCSFYSGYAAGKKLIK